MSILTLAEYRTLSGDSTTADATVQSALDRYTAIIERYCNRTWGATCYYETYYSVMGDPLVLAHDNVQQITEILVNSTEYDPESFDIVMSRGFIHHEGIMTGTDVEVRYTAGSTAPDDVQHVLATLVQGFLAGTTGGTAALNPIAQETVYGVASTKYALSGWDVESGGHPELGAYTVLLDPYVDMAFA
jgi:hypothetical protein